MRTVVAGLMVMALPAAAGAKEKRPNILFCISDDQSWLHAGAMGDPVVKTPAFDRVAREGILFTQAYCDAPSCAPSCSAILTGQHIWRLEEAGNIHSRLPEKFPTYSRLLEASGYAIGSYSKAWSPGQFKTSEGWVHSGRTKQNPAGDSFKSFEAFYQSRPKGKPFCFWLGSTDAHRGYKRDSGIQSGMDPAKVVVPAHLPDDPVVRRDILDYYFEVQRFDRLVGDALAVLEKAGELDNTLVVITSDNGMPFPRAKASLYDYGTRMPLAVRWPGRIKAPGRTYEGFVHLSDMAPTFLEAAGLRPPRAMTARSLTDVFTQAKAVPRDAAFTAMERHDGCRKGGKGYPCRALRTRDFLYIRNYEPDRWPAGDPDAANCARAIPFGEVDPSPSKSLLMDKKGAYATYHRLAFGKRPAEELYDLRTDPGQVANVAADPAYAETRSALSARLQQYTARTGDPRALDEDAPWDYYPYYGSRKNRNWEVDSRPIDHPKAGPAFTPSTPEMRRTVSSAWRPLPSAPGGGLLAERVALWRTERLWHMVDAEDDYLLSGFESRPGRHPWQGEHVGKWLHAATLAYEQTRDEKLGKTLRKTVDRLLAAQQPNGYLGTYGDNYTFMALPENTSKSAIVDDVAPTKNKGKKPQRKARPRGGWDTWTFRYNLYGLLTYERFHPDKRIVEACRKMADLLIKVYGEGKSDLTQYGTRRGISATTLLESIMMLYERTRDEKYLNFAEHIVACSENASGLRLMGTMLKEGSVVYPGDGKAYQLMANLLGYLLLYKHTGDERYVKTVQNGWENILAHHIDATGGPWSRHMSYNGNRECFALPRDFDPAEADVETCSSTTWIQMNLHLLELTGQARYAAEAERAVFNTLLAAQYPEGIDWCYYTRANQVRRPYEGAIKCCSSSGPRALEMFSHYLIGEVDGGVSLTSLAPCSAVLPEACGKATIKVTGDYPVSPKAGIRFEQAAGKTFALEFRDPWGARLKSARINGEDTALRKNDRGFYRIGRAWKTGDEIAVEFEYLLTSHTEAPQGRQKWVAFTYGPWAMAQEIKKGPALAEPFVGKDVSSKPASEWIEPCPTEKGAAPRFRIKGTDIVLEPFHSAGGHDTGPRTYFRFGPLLPQAPPKPKPKKKGQTPGKVDLSADVAKFAPGWTVSNCGNAMEPGLRGETRGRKNVLVTHPFSTAVPCVLRRTVAIPAGRKTALRLVVGHDPRGDWQLVVKVAGKELLARTIGKSTTEKGWATLTVDLSDYAGTSVEIALENRANGWSWEAAHWGSIEIGGE